jgi:uncharacterized phage protein (TIGR01671 family)
MNRTVKFRGKTLINGEWIFGSYLNQYFSTKSQKLIDAIAYTVGNQTFRPQVDPSTVGEFTGLSDKNGKEIYEGDIVKWGHMSNSRENPVRIAIVEILPDIQFRILNFKDYEQPVIFRYGSFAYQNTQKALEIIGNQWDNPELLKQEEL